MEESEEGGCFKTMQLLCLDFMINTLVKPRIKVGCNSEALCLILCLHTVFHIFFFFF